MSKMDPAIERLRNEGWMPKIADHLGIQRQAPYLWTRVPVDRVLAISELTGIPVWELRPDYYPKSLFNKQKRA